MNHASSSNRLPRQPRWRKDETWEHYCQRLAEWEQHPQVQELRAFRQWQRDHWAEIQAEIAAQVERDRELWGNDLPSLVSQRRFDAEVAEGRLIRVFLPLNPSKPRPALCGTYYCNPAGLRWLQARRAGVELPRTRPADHCMHHRSHPCFQPEPAAEVTWYFVIYRLPPPPHLLPLEEFWPAEYRRDYQQRLCCPQAARLLVRELHAEGMRDIRLTTDAQDPAAVDFARHLNVTMPCLQGVET